MVSTNSIKLAYLYVRRVVLVKNYFNVSLLEKIKANLQGYIADQYVLYDLENNDPKDYLSEMDWHRSRFINQPFDFVLNNKVICNQVLSPYVKVPDIFAIKIDNRIFGDDSNSAQDVLVFIKQHKKLFLKPYLGGKGNDVYCLECCKNQFLINKKIKKEEDILRLLNTLKNWMVCEAVEQHDYASQLYDKTFNTIRIVTIRDTETYQMNIVFAVQRVGTSDTIPVDNGSKGSIVAKINLVTGRLSKAKSLHNLMSYSRHPDSNNEIEGITIPHWETIKQEITMLANRLSYLQLIAWDILVMRDGNICVIEANNSTGVNILQLWGGLKRHSFGQFLKCYRQRNKV